MTSPAPDRRLPPGSTIGIIGGGQLGRMTALAAARLGYRCHIYTPELDSPAAQVSAAATVADYDDEIALIGFAEAVDVVTFEFENVPADSVRLLADRRPVRPGWNVLRIAQDRLLEKEFFASIGIETAPWRAVRSAGDLAAAIDAIGRPAVLKTTRLGYDGKGQVKIDAAITADEAWGRLGAEIGVLEGFIDFGCEVSVLAARAVARAVAGLDVGAKRHHKPRLAVTVAPADLPPNLLAEARRMGERSAEALGLVGLLAVEMFVTRDGRILANEMAPRPHNSGHWTMDACLTDQFEQFVRAVCGLPLGSPERHSDAEMKNLIGGDADAWAEILAEPGARLHLYGKAEARPGRKMGHVNRIRPRRDTSAQT